MQPEVRMAHKLDRFDAVIDNAGVGYRERRVLLLLPRPHGNTRLDVAIDQSSSGTSCPCQTSILFRLR